MVAKCDEVPHCCDEVFIKDLANTGQEPPSDCEGVDCSPCKKGLFQKTVEGLFSLFESAPPEEPPMIHEEPFIPEVRPEIQPEVRPPPPPPPKKAPPSAFDGQMKPLAPPPMHEPIIGYDTAGNPIYDTPPPMDWGQIPIIGPIIDTMKGIPVNGEPPHEIPPVHPVGLPPHEEQAQLDPEEIEHRKRIVADFDTQEQEKLDNKSGELTDAGWKEWDNLRATYLDVSKPRFDYWRAIAENINTHTIPPVDCEYNAWSEWSPCEGRWNDRPHKTQERHRSVKTQAKYGGTPCSESDTREEKPCPDVDCEYGAWSDWGTPALVNNPNGGDGQPEQIWAQIRTKSPLSQASGDGEVCFPPPPHNKSKKEVRPVSPVDCEIEWLDWSPCADGIQHRNANILTKPKFGGKECDFLQETRECEMPVVEEPLPPVATVPVAEPVTPASIIEAEKLNPIDILLGWIDMGGGLENTVVAPTVPVQVDGGTGQGSLLPAQTTPVAPAETTPVVTEEPVQTTPAPVDCHQEVSEWREWSDCRYGKRSRGRTLTTHPAENGGEPCGPKPVLREREDCEEEPIGSLCGFGAWDSWSEWDCGSEWPQGEQWYMTRTRKRYTTYLLTQEDDYRVHPSLGDCRKEHPLEDTMENGIGIASHIEWLNDEDSSGVMVQVQTERQKCPPCQEGYVRSDNEANFSQCEPLPVEETPPPADDTSTGGGGAPAETTEEEETEVEKCEDKNRETNADGSCGASCKDGHDWESTEADAKCVCVKGCWKKWAMYGGLLAGMASGGYYYFVKRKG